MPWFSAPLPLLLLTGGLIGATFPLGKIAAEAGVDPVAWAFLISAGAGLVLLVALTLQGRPPAMSGRHLRYYAIGGAISYALPNILVFTLIPRLGAGYTSLVFTLSPIVTLTFATLLRVRRPTGLGVAGIGIGFVGALLIVLSKGQIDRPAEPLAIALALLVPVSLAAGNIYRTLDWPPGADGETLAAGTNLGSAVILAAALAVLAPPGALTTLAAVPALSVAQVVASAIMFAVFFRLQTAGGPVYLSQIGYVAAAVGLGSGTLFLGEAYGPLTWIGGLVVVAGVVTTTLAQRREVPS